MVFSVFWLRLPKNRREKRKRGRRFFDHETTETFDDGTPSIHTDTRHQHHHHGFYYCFKYRSRRGIICESSFSLVFDSSSFFSLSLSLRARMRAVLASRLFTPLFYPFLNKNVYNTQAQQQQPQQQRTKVVSRASAPPTCSLSFSPSARANGDDANADVGRDSKTEMAKTKCVHPERQD